MKYTGKFGTMISGKPHAIEAYETAQFLMFEHDIVWTLSIWIDGHWKTLHYHPGALHVNAHDLFNLANLVYQLAPLVQRKPGFNVFQTVRSAQALLDDFRDRQKYPVEGYYDLISPPSRYFRGSLAKDEIVNAPHLFAG